MRYGLDRYVDGSIIIIAAMIAFGIIYKHKVNIRRLIAGTENKVGAGTSALLLLRRHILCELKANMSKQRIGIIGAGSFGTALAKVFHGGEPSPSLG